MRFCANLFYKAKYYFKLYYWTMWWHLQYYKTQPILRKLWKLFIQKIVHNQKQILKKNFLTVAVTIKISNYLKLWYILSLRLLNVADYVLLNISNSCIVMESETLANLPISIIHMYKHPWHFHSLNRDRSKP